MGLQDDNINLKTVTLIKEGQVCRGLYKNLNKKLALQGLVKAESIDATKNISDIFIVVFIILIILIIFQFKLPSITLPRLRYMSFINS